MSNEKDSIKLTQYSHGAGCGCKISPKVLDQILQGITKSTTNLYPQLLVGNESKDDAAVYNLGDGTALISTTDFFMPIVDDAFDFGMIASANALSDVYAMGGAPLMAVAILGWTINKLPPELAGQVLEGSRQICAQAGIPLAGGHTIDSPEPFFGLAVTGRVAINHLKRNNTATIGCKLFLTKPLGVGLLTTMEKGNILAPEHRSIATHWMKVLNSAGEQFGKLTYVKAMTDVTGFGLLGHLVELCEGSGLSAVLDYSKVPVIEAAQSYLFPFLAPEGTQRNWESYQHKVSLSDQLQKIILADPQTSGGLLVAVEAEHENEFKILAKTMGLSLESFGELVEQREKVVILV